MTQQEINLKALEQEIEEAKHKYESLKETYYQLKNPANAKFLLDGIAAIKANEKLIQQNIHDLDKKDE